MKFKMMATALMLCKVAFAGNFYVGAGLDYNAYKDVDNDIGNSIFVGYKSELKIGGQENLFVAGEVGFSKLGTFTEDYTQFNPVVTVTGKANTIHLTGTVSYKLDDKFEPFIRLGLHDYTVNTTTTSGAITVKGKYSETKPVFGFGFNSKFANNLSARYDYRIYKTGEEFKDIISSSLSLVYKF